ncbi:MAG: hypothetical protein GAK30_02069 [Paracidovorax wautersii]|uniref:Anti-sigma K factor RskA C-terminal domain-containing protein n=1 Tax=Paracidovorax wautersii TaxID=1177982 RepID=A0A7V8FNT0_9BURK|nr:MAG: hypothetical protein GAK30_02069 [Paracidovorax wautersii]
MSVASSIDFETLDEAGRSALAGEFVLGTLAAAERHAVAARLGVDEALRRAVDGWHEQLLPLAALAPAIEPSPGLWARIERSLRAVAVPAPSPSARKVRNRWWDSLRLWRGLSATGFAAAAVLAAVLVARPVPEPAEPRFVVVLVAPQSQSPGWVVQASARDGQAAQQVSLIPLGAMAVPADKVLEFWTKADGWSQPVSLGLVQPGQRLQVPLDRLPPLQNNQLFELTLEAPGGSPTGLPTGPIQAIGRAVEVY